MKDITTILWTIGCVKDIFGFSDSNLMSNLTISLSNVILTNETSLESLNERSIVKILWSLAVHSKSDDILFSYFLQKLPNYLPHLSSTDIVTIIWSCGRTKYIHKTSISLLLQELYLRMKSNNFPISESGLAAESILDIYNLIESSTQSLSLLTKLYVYNISTSNSIINASSSMDINFITYNIMNWIISSVMINNSSLSTVSIASILHSSSSFGLSSESLLNVTKVRLFDIFESKENLSPSIAASFLESLGLMRSKMTFSPLHTSPSSSALLDTDSFNQVFSQADHVRKLLSDPEWHFIAGKLSAVCSTQSSPPLSSSSPASIASHSLHAPHITRSDHQYSEAVPPAVATATSATTPIKISPSTSVTDIEGTSELPSASSIAGIQHQYLSTYLDRLQLLNACWGIAEMGHQCRVLLRSVSKSVQFALHELSPVYLGRLVIAVSVEEAGSAAGQDRHIASAKLDREFVDQLAMMALRR